MSDYDYEIEEEYLQNPKDQLQYVNHRAQKMSKNSESDLEDDDIHNKQKRTFKKQSHPRSDNDSESQERDENQSQSRSSQQSSTGSEEGELTQEQKLQAEVLQMAINLEESTPYQSELTMELFEKLKDFKYLSSTRTGDELVTARIQELVINKLLVLTYNKHQMRLVLAHYHLGQAYLMNDCVQQSIEHLSLALNKVEKVFESIPLSKLLQIQMQNELAKALIKKQSYEDAIQILTDSINSERILKEQRRKQQIDSELEETTKNTRAMILLSQCYIKINEHDQAIKVIDEVISITRKKKMGKQEYAFALVEKAKLLALQKTYAQAITFQQEAIDILMQENYSKPEEVAELYTVLASYHEQLGNIENSLTCIQKVKTLYQQLYSVDDKRVIKARRKIATFLLKSERFKQAVNELLEVVDLQEKVFGENSLQTARTLKLLGAVYISLQVSDARAYLKRAMNIFQSHGNKKQVQQIRQKLKMLYNGGETENKDIKIIGSEQQI